MLPTSAVDPSDSQHFMQIHSKQECVFVSDEQVRQHATRLESARDVTTSPIHVSLI